MWMVFELVGMSSVLVLGFVIGRIWEIRMAILHPQPEDVSSSDRINAPHETRWSV